jgi:sirohydrochlorin cobaltochelatase
VTNVFPTLEELQLRIRTLLPEEYQDSYEDLKPAPMRSAGLKYAADGTVAWDQIWGSFCDLAMAGGPPHKGALLEAGTRADVDSQPARYDEVATEIARGITLATDLPADPSPRPGWVRVTCYGETMAEWLLRAIVMENVAVRRYGIALDLPAAPGFRLEKEIKNVITVIAKTSHYWLGHMPRAQKASIEQLLAKLAAERPLVEPADPADSPADSIEATLQQLATRMSDGIHRATVLSIAPARYHGWLGVTCPNVRAAVWLMRGAVACNVLARREGTVLFVPVNPMRDPGGQSVVTTVHGLHQLAAANGVL